MSPLLLRLAVSTAVLGLVLSGCDRQADPEIVRACEEVRTLEERVLELAGAETSEPEELGTYVGEMISQARAVKEAAEDTGDADLIEAASRANDQVSVQVATIALDTQDPRAAAAPMAREVITMRDACRDHDAYPE